jgi:Domain of Unknown Function (DUF928)
MQNKSLVKLVFRYLPILIGTIVLMPTTLIQSQTMVVQQPKHKKQKRKLPPPPAPRKNFPSDRSVSAGARQLPPPPTPTKDFPANRSVSASEGTCDDLKLVALAPEFKRTTANQITETHVWGQTTKSNPTFWFFIPSAPPGTELEFSLQDRQEQDIYRSSITTPTQPGVISIQLPSGRPPLQLGQDYRWTLTARVPCDNAEPTRVHVDGWISRVNLAVGDKDSYNTYANKGIWYDAVTSLAQQRLQKPNDRYLKQEWFVLLSSESINLYEIADRPLLKQKFQK